jgi:hypothetical protein
MPGGRARVRNTAAKAKNTSARATRRIVM